MISTESFSKEWIIECSNHFKYNDKHLLEKVIRAKRRNLINMC